MKVLKTTLTEILGLFVEDGSLAVGILVWVGIVAVAFPLAPGLAWKAPAIFVGLVVLLMENVWRSTRKRLRRK